MKCPYCSNMQTSVTDSRITGTDSEAIRRRRQCDKCSKRFTTYEHMELPDITVIKKNGTRELFSYEKLFRGVAAACEKRPITQEQIKNIVSSVEQNLRKRGKTLISSRKVGEMAMKKLRKIDEVAYIRFASVYQEFESISDFTKKVRELKKK